jgi:hypothetical protein
VAAVALLVAPGVTGPLGRRAAGAAAIAGVVACLAGPTAWALDTVSTPKSGSIVTAGPAVAGGRGGSGGGRFPGGGQIPNGGRFPGGGQIPNGGRIPAGGQIPNGGQFPRGGQIPNGGQFPGGGQIPGGGLGGGSTGGLLDSAEVSEEVVQALLEHADQYTWVAAAVGSNRAAGFQLATERSVMPIGGFNGSDPSPTLAQFQQDVANGRIHWFISGGGFGQSMGGSQEASDIETWVTEHFTPTTVDGVTLYDLTSGTA